MALAICNKGPRLRQFIRCWVPAAATASVATTAALAACGEAEDGEPLAPINAISHILWGPSAYQARDFSPRHTVTGLALNAAFVSAWALLFGWLVRESRRPEQRLGAGLFVAAIAYLVDYHGVPERLKPGFERHLMPRSLLLVYLILALSLAYAPACLGGDESE